MQSSAKHKAELKWLHSTEAANQAAADNFKAGLKWLQTPEAAKLSAAAKAKALSYFRQRYPNADMGAFEVQVTFDKNHKATGSGISRDILLSSTSLDLTHSCDLFICFTFISQQDRYCLRWVEFKALVLCQVIPHSARQTTPTTCIASYRRI